MSRFSAKQTVAVLKFAGSLSYLRSFYIFCDCIPNFKKHKLRFGWYTKKKNNNNNKLFLTNYMERQSVINDFLFFIICSLNS